MRHTSMDAETFWLVCSVTTSSLWPRYASTLLGESRSNGCGSIPSISGGASGQAMLDRLEARASELGYNGICLDTTTLQEAAIALFEKNGYREVGRGKRGSFDLVIFEKDLG